MGTPVFSACFRGTSPTKRGKRALLGDLVKSEVDQLLVAFIEKIATFGASEKDKLRNPGQENGPNHLGRPTERGPRLPPGCRKTYAQSIQCLTLPPNPTRIAQIGSAIQTSDSENGAAKGSPSRLSQLQSPQASEKDPPLKGQRNLPSNFLEDEKQKEVKRQSKPDCREPEWTLIAATATSLATLEAACMCVFVCDTSYVTTRQTIAAGNVPGTQRVTKRSQQDLRLQIPFFPSSPRSWSFPCNARL